MGGSRRVDKNWWRTDRESGSSHVVEKTRAIAALPPVFPHMATCKQVADALGVTQFTVYDWIKDSRNPLPVQPIRGRYRILRVDLEFWLSAQRRTA